MLTTPEQVIAATAWAMVLGGAGSVVARHIITETRLRLRWRKIKRISALPGAGFDQ